MADAVKPCNGLPSLRLSAPMKSPTSSGMSEVLARSGGTSMGKTFRRYSKSALNVPAWTDSSRFRFVEAMTRTSTRTVLLVGKRFLLHDRDPLFSDSFRETLAATGVETVRLPPSSPSLNGPSRKPA